MLPSDLDLCRLCAASEGEATGFDFIENGAESGIWFGIKKYETVNAIIFRGSVTEGDWLRDGQFFMTMDDDVGAVHEGFLRNLPALLEKYSDHIGQAPFVSGHSLGAARAAILSGMMINRLNPPSKVVLFGCPRPGAHELRDMLASVQVISYRNRRDPVTELPETLPPLFPYVPVKDLYPLDGMVDFSLLEPFRDHHALNYCAGLENINKG